MNTRKGSCAGGMILVAANSAEEAHQVFHSDPDLKWMWDAWYYDSFDSEPRTKDYVYDPTLWEELPILTANVDEPQVLAENGYTD